MPFYAQLKGECPVIGMCVLPWYLGCAFESDKKESVIKMAQTAFVDSLVGGFDIQYETRTPASVEVDIKPKIIDGKEGDWPYKQVVGDCLWISGMMRPDIIVTTVRAVAWQGSPYLQHRVAT